MPISVLFLAKTRCFQVLPKALKTPAAPQKKDVELLCNFDTSRVFIPQIELMGAKSGNNKN